MLVQVWMVRSFSAQEHISVNIGHSMAGAAQSRPGQPGDSWLTLNTNTPTLTTSGDILRTANVVAGTRIEFLTNHDIIGLSWHRLCILAFWEKEMDPSIFKCLSRRKFRQYLIETSKPHSLSALGTASYLYFGQGQF